MRFVVFCDDCFAFEVEMLQLWLQIQSKNCQQLIEMKTEIATEKVKQKLKEKEKQTKKETETDTVKERVTPAHTM